MLLIVYFMSQDNKNIEKLVLGAGLAILLLASGVYYFWDVTEKQKEEISELKSELQDTKGDLVDANIKVGSLRGEKSTLEQEKMQETAEKEFAYYFAEFTAEKLDELEDILLEYDADSTEVIEFYASSCYLYEPELTQANLYYGAWQAATAGYAKRYERILNEINDLVGDL